MLYLILFQIVALCYAYDLKCPEPAEWFMRSKLLCQNPAKYSCLHNDLAPSGYSENCTIEDFEPAGRIIILRGGKDAGDCTQNRYQPAGYIYRTYISTDCIYFKSLCNEEGQVVYRKDPDYTSDTTCRCDYTRGYDFVTRPSNPCYCIPSQEDCSCYLRSCLNTLHLLSPDYQCIGKTLNNLTRSCPVLPTIRPKDHIWNLTNTQGKRDIPIYWKHFRFLQKEKWLVSVCCVSVTVGMCFIVWYLTIRKEYLTKPLGTVTCIESKTFRVQSLKDGTNVSTSYKYKGETDGQAKPDIKEYLTKPLGTVTCIESKTFRVQSLKDGTNVSTSYKGETDGQANLEDKEAGITRCIKPRNKRQRRKMKKGGKLKSNNQLKVPKKKKAGFDEPEDRGDKTEYIEKEQTKNQRRKERKRKKKLKKERKHKQKLLKDDETNPDEYKT